MNQKSTPIYQIKVTLNGTHPPIWRRFQVSGNYSLYQLHYVLQTVMGWDNSHLHQFTIDGEFYSDPADDEFGSIGTSDEMRFKLNKVIPRNGFKFIYEYDFGDSWTHTLLVEKILTAERGVRYPICIKGKRACPPDDIGGIWGYESFLEAINDPKHPDYDEYQEWFGGEFDPEAFDLEGINQELHRPMSESWLEVHLSPYDVIELPAPELSDSEKKQLEGLMTSSNEAVAEKLALRRDVLALVGFLGENKITGTQATGNLPRKAVEGIAALFVDPPILEETLGDKTYRFRNEQEIWPVYFTHLLAVAADLIDGGQNRRWQVTEAGELFKDLPAALQVYVLLGSWWWKVNWIVAYPVEGIGDSLPEEFARIALELLLQIPSETTTPYQSFADRLIEISGLEWSKQESEYTAMLLHSAIERMLLIPLEKFGVLSLEYKPDQLLGSEFRKISSFTMTHFGESILKTLDVEL